MWRRTAIAMLLLAGAMVAGQPQKGFGTYKARELSKSDVWINGGPFTLKSLRGKVVVIDFWAFDCAPCIEAMPRVLELHSKHAKDGLVVIGVHTPRAEYEKDIPKLREAMTRMGVTFPVVVDNKQKIFRDYLCDLWPSLFVIDRDGIVRFSHGGVGRYDDIEHMVRQLLDKQ